MGIGISEKLVKLIEREVTALDLEFVGVVRAQEGRTPVLRIYIDSPSGLTVDHCVTVTRQLSRVLDVEEPAASHYRLEVSSPGLDRPLFTKAHYERFVGHELKVKVHAPIQGQRRFVGTLAEVNDEGIVLSVAPPAESVAIAFTAIEKAHLVPKF